MSLTEGRQKRELCVLMTLFEITEFLFCARVTGWYGEIEEKD